MIIRVLGDAVYEVPEADVPAIEQLDDTLDLALEKGDEAMFSGALADLHNEVRHSGKMLAPDDLRPSTMVVPHAGSTLQEVRELLASGAEA